METYDEVCRGWLASCDVDWQAVAAIATFCAVVAALVNFHRDARRLKEASSIRAAAYGGDLTVCITGIVALTNEAVKGLQNGLLNNSGGAADKAVAAAFATLHFDAFDRAAKNADVFDKATASLIGILLGLLRHLVRDAAHIGQHSVGVLNGEYAKRAVDLAATELLPRLRALGLTAWT